MVNRVDAKDWAREKMKGLWTTPAVPFTENYAVDEAGMKHNIEHLLKTKVSGIGFGFTEPWVMSIAERKRAMEVSIGTINKRVSSYLHATDHSVEETINLINHAEAVGSDAVMVWTPYEWAKDQQMIGDYFEYITSKTNLAIFPYNTYHSGISMTTDTVRRLAKIPAVCAFKDAINDVAHTVDLIEAVGKEIVICEPLEDHLLTMVLQFGQVQLLGATSVFLMQSPHCQPVQEYFDLARAGKAAEASRKYYELQPLRDVWKGIYQVLWDKKAASHPLAYIKYWMELLGMKAGPLRPPMHNLTDAQKAEFKARLEATGWLEKLAPKGASSKAA